MIAARLVLLACIATACSDRAESGPEAPDAMPMPGLLGGLCLAPDGHCADATATCNRDENYCFDPADPCSGFACGGVERGVCTPSNGQPSCACNEGYENETFSLYCCPNDDSDPNCM